MKTYQSRIINQNSSFLFALLSLSLMVGCGDKTAEQPTAKQPATPSNSDNGDLGNKGGHSHGAGPHGGTLADWGGGAYHVEFTVDHDKKEATVYILGSDEKTPEPIIAESVLLTINDPELQADLLPVPLESDSDGKSSRFVGTHESLAIVQEYGGTLSAAVDGTPYAGNFMEVDDSLVWEGEPKEHAGLIIKLGHHSKLLHVGEEVEPAVSITRDGEAVSDAKVFNALFSADGKTELAKEVATVYEPTTEEEPAHYAQGALAIPKGVASVVIRFRLVPSGADTVTFNVPVTVE
ncbi:MAG: hypothetical protein ABGZ53_26795 [Fuerstiella sp.]|jgi:hypothetical protein